MQFAVTADRYFPVQKMPCFTVRINIQTKKLNPVKADRVPAEPRYTVTPPALTGAITASNHGRAAATPQFNRGQPGLHRKSIQTFNTSVMNQELPGRTGNDRLCTGNNRNFTGNNRDGTVRAPVYLCNVAIKRLCRHSPGLHQGVAVALLGCVWAPVELRCRPGCSRYSPGCSRCHAGRCRSYLVTPCSSHRY
ncbi:hypothetical protein DPMN_142790 [Dreissena polymorpha]|uniref:Uncharacterized protein n=1 Tax=Dreissena polymorpha TaxID=45954 RepID=A0A9D4JJH0_DREPO|nr:hypothetical protein DPMN_142790 [Dreissena polymorpha]